MAVTVLWPRRSTRVSRTILGATLLLLVAACGAQPVAQPAATASAASSPAARASAATTPLPQPAFQPTGTVATDVRCDASFNPSHTLVIGTVRGEAGVVIRDIQDSDHALSVCHLTGDAGSATFVDAGSIAYVSGGWLVRADLATGRTAKLVENVGAFGNIGPFGRYGYAFSPDGKALSYLRWMGRLETFTSPPVPVEWRLLRDGKDTLVDTLKAATMYCEYCGSDTEWVQLGFSPDGEFMFAGGWQFIGAQATDRAPFQVRQVAGGKQVYTASTVGKALWPATPNRLLHDSPDRTTKVQWTSAKGSTSVAMIWGTGATASPDGRLIASWGEGDPPDVTLVDVSTGTLTLRLHGRGHPRFLSNNLLWYDGEIIDHPGAGLPSATGDTFIYDFAKHLETASRLLTVADVWPRLTEAPA